MYFSGSGSDTIYNKKRRKRASEWICSFIKWLEEKE